jgi:glutamate-1-semialdehyde 2,1-aminomutase
MTSTIVNESSLLNDDRRWRERAADVVPGGMYGHQSVSTLPDTYPQFFARGEGSRIWDVDGNEYVDLMCSYGPMILGHHHLGVDDAARRQAALGDCQNGPATVMVELAERLVDRVAHADWAIFAKNGTDATTTCVTIARAATGKSRVLVADGAYHGAAPWCTPRLDGVIAEDRAQLDSFVFNDVDSVVAAVERAQSDLAAIIISPFKHDAGFDQELVDPDFARALRRICDDTGAALVLDDVRCGFRLSNGGSWEPIGVDPDLSAWSKAIANGHPLAAVLGNDRFRDATSSIFVTGSFWFAAVPMAAGIATLAALEAEHAVDSMLATGQRLRDGLDSQAAAHGLAIRQTGPVQMPYLTFDGDTSYERANVWAAESVRRGAFVHPRHNWFLGAAHTDADIDRALVATDAGFAAVAERFGRS